MRESNELIKAPRVHFASWKEFQEPLKKTVFGFELTQRTVSNFAVWAALLWLSWEFSFIAIAQLLLLFPFLALAGRAMAAQYLIAPKRLLDMMDLPSPGPQFAVCVKVYSDTQMVGQDYGIVTFVEDHIYFDGERTRFELAPSLLSGKPLELDYHWTRIGWSGGGFFGYLEFAVYDQIPGRTTKHRNYFRRLLKKYADAPKTGQTSLLLPPRTKYVAPVRKPLSLK